MPRHTLDTIDAELLRVLQTEGRIKRGELADRVGLSIPAVSDRLRKLEQRGIIRGYFAALDPLKVGLGVTAFILIVSESSRHFKQIVKRALKHKEILECHAVTGEGTHLIKARTQSTTSLERLLGEIQAWPGVINTRTSVVLSSPKESLAVPLDHLGADAGS